jgi:hypothetical protein
MTADRKKLIILLVGVLILAVVLMPILKPSVDFKKMLPFGKSKQGESIVPSGLDEKTDYLPLLASARQTRNSFVYIDAGRRDPMVPLVVSAPRAKRKKRTYRPPKLFLEGIVWSQRVPVAVINGTILEVHDFIRGAKVLQIRHDRVTLLYRSKEFVLMLE